MHTGRSQPSSRLGGASEWFCEDSKPELYGRDVRQNPRTWLESSTNLQKLYRNALRRKLTEEEVKGCRGGTCPRLPVAWWLLGKQSYSLFRDAVVKKRWCKMPLKLVKMQVARSLLLWFIITKPTKTRQCHLDKVQFYLKKIREKESHEPLVGRASNISMSTLQYPRIVPPSTVSEKWYVN